ncbi:MAG: DUF2851 family protein [Chitinophagaceae bacterium]
MITERLLQFIWQFQYFNKNGLCTSAGEPLKIIHGGIFNTSQGPDFVEARIHTGNTLWAGQIELHLQTSLWYQHKHHQDEHYRNVILHVVWEHNTNDLPGNIPVLSLQDRVSKVLLQQYEQWMNAPASIPCSEQLMQIKRIVWLTWKERLLVERMQRKSELVFSYLEQNNHHWEETFWWLLARNFGIKVNADAFEAIARSLPVTLLAKHKKQLQQLEALLLGQAGLLEQRSEDKYVIMLQREYHFYQKKYSLQHTGPGVLFLRMRPGNFPPVRLAQLAMLVHQSEHLFSKIKETRSIQDVKSLLNVTAGDFWHYHYTLENTSAYKPKKLGDAMTDNIIINTIVPVLFAYGHLHNDEVFKERALRWLEALAPENNTITASFTKLGCTNQNAFDSQALIELKNNYCNTRRCLDCAAGNAILKQSVA